MSLITVQEGTSALVLDSPHSGTDYPADFGFACDFTRLRQAEDTHVEKLYAGAPARGCHWIEAHFPRSYLDANRNADEIDPELLEAPWPGPLAGGSKVRLGKGLIWRMTDDGLPIYRRRLSVAEVQARIERCWAPYHAAVARAVEQAQARHGYCIHLNCHSMPAVASTFATEFPGLEHADIVLGNRDHSTCSPALIERLRQHFEQRGYSVSVNHPYKGVELVRRHGDPARHRHSVQVELNRRLYMDERTLQPHDGFERLQRDLDTMIGMLLGLDPRQA
ncbi:N-formylglutamate deformylase [Sphaerotilus hippei]|uniref:N-formylglutamate deformylase n=1 Tax=Sphaerotilus hippei TaxID=744406 RepID=A0A318H1L1_9BURK|nr:N-formylglutamate amidohydrolase [Sphaerotilus hippei]PXW96918.1 N-formylglutamate deformylase [Sphaerotilus hippei]